MICKLDQNNYCERHQTIHVGRLLELSQEDSEKGEKYRILWDDQLKNPGKYNREEVKPKSFLQKAGNFGSALLKWAKEGFPTVSDDVYEHRISICNGCDQLSERRQCMSCSCFVDEKALWSTENCPQNRWELPVIQGNSGCGCNK